MRDRILRQLVTAAVARLHTDMGEAPFLAQQVSDWLRRWSGRDLVTRCLDPDGFPLLQMPYWWACTTRPKAEPEWDVDVIYASLNSYLLTRLLESAREGGEAAERRLLPAAGFFHSRFQAAYQAYFPAGHPFWEDFQAALDQSAETTLREAFLAEVDRRAFLEVSARRFCAARIPIAAVAHRSGHVYLLPAWSRFIDCLGAWYQMTNDFFDWHHDNVRGIRTYLLAEADRRRRPGEPVASWFVREGFGWSVATLSAWMTELKETAHDFGCPELLQFLLRRESAFLEQRNQAAERLERLRPLVEAIE